MSHDYDDPVEFIPIDQINAHMALQEKNIGASEKSRRDDGIGDEFGLPNGRSVEHVADKDHLVDNKDGGDEEENGD